jgi:hypothetical protein
MDRIVGAEGQGVVLEGQMNTQSTGPKKSPTR